VAEPGAGPVRRLAAEAVGTGFLAMAIIGAGVMADGLTDDVALVLLANMIAAAAALTVLISLLGPISGAHLNPAVTLAFALKRQIGPGAAIAYALAQIAGGLVGAVIAHLMFGLDPLSAGIHDRSGFGQFLSEGVATFGLVATILLALAFRPAAVAALAGLYLASAYWFTATASFANPAVTLARSLTATFTGIRPADAPAFIAAQLLGAALAVVAVHWLAPAKAR